MLEKETKNLKLYVELIAKKYEGLGVPVEDLIQEGYIGIFKAKEHFDKTKNVKFSSYAIWWIRQSIINALNTQSRLVHMPFGKINLFRKIKNLREKYLIKYHREPSDTEIRAELQLSCREHMDTVHIQNQAIYIDREIDDESKTTLENLFVFENSFEQELELEDLKKIINKALEKLTERENSIIVKFFGLNGEPKLGLEEIGQALDLTRERCRQIKKEALNKLKKEILFFFNEKY